MIYLQKIYCGGGLEECPPPSYTGGYKIEEERRVWFLVETNLGYDINDERRNGVTSRDCSYIIMKTNQNA